MTSSFLGEKLHMIRIFHDLSLDELGQIVVATKQYIHQLETNSTTPNIDMVNALAEALFVKNNFFYIPATKLIMEEHCHFRKLKTTPINIKNKAINRGYFFKNLINHLDDDLEFPNVNFPTKFYIHNDNDIEKIAEQCRKQWGLGLNSPIQNMVRVLENSGVFITCFDQLSEKVDAFSISATPPLVIRNSAKDSVCRLRFDLAHECGHIVMHYDKETGDNKTEMEANRFASAFLLPRTAFLNEFSFLKNSNRINWQNLYALKRRWKVSLAAIIKRAYDLELLDAVQYRKAYIFLRKTGQAKREKYDDYLTEQYPETPEMLINALKIIDSTNYYIIQDYLDNNGFKIDIVEKLTGYKFQNNISHNDKIINIQHLRRTNTERG